MDEYIIISSKKILRSSIVQAVKPSKSILTYIFEVKTETLERLHQLKAQVNTLNKLLKLTLHDKYGDGKNVVAVDINKLKKLGVEDMAKTLMQSRRLNIKSAEGLYIGKCINKPSLNANNK